MWGMGGLVLDSLRCGWRCPQLSAYCVPPATCGRCVWGHLGRVRFRRFARSCGISPAARFAPPNSAPFCVDRASRSANLRLDPSVFSNAGGSPPESPSAGEPRFRLPYLHSPERSQAESCRRRHLSPHEHFPSRIPPVLHGDAAPFFAIIFRIRVWSFSAGRRESWSDLELDFPPLRRSRPKRLESVARTTDHFGEGNPGFGHRFVAPISAPLRLDGSNSVEDAFVESRALAGDALNVEETF